ASLAIENALKSISPGVNTLNINAFRYTNPILEKVINRTYMSVIKRKPEVWEYLYDNPKVLKSVQGLRDVIHRFNSKKLKNLLEDFKPSSVICTQAFPCGMVADCKKAVNSKLPLVGVLTDHAPHSYWIFKDVDYYITPSEASKESFIRNGVDESKIKVFGIPIDPKFAKTHDRNEICEKSGLDPDVPVILVMGGSQGLGPVESMVHMLDALEACFQVVVICGTNRRLKKILLKKAKHCKKNMVVFGHVQNVDEIMEVSSLVITKPGGLTTAEAMAKNLPMIIAYPIPGQEAKNTDFLLRQGVAVKAEDSEDVAAFTQELISGGTKLAEMRARAVALKKPDAAMDIARLVLGN
ncbi:MAG: glycosyltransferase, partial [Candidatus Omnitrophica bacterium]|nr:glycosyltransferase [Candidatus Omnitrophota bacterium]